MAPPGKAEHIIEDVAGCGLFQIVFFACVAILYKVVMAFNVIFMAFGNYNPGWRCLDNTTVLITPITNETEFKTVGVSTGSDEVEKYTVGSCDDYRKCNDVEFNPDSSTVVTEWGLLCDESWVVSFIISMQMVGMLIGSYSGGHLADWIGRKKTVCLALIICSVSHLISSFSVSWTMLIVCRFLIGMCAASNLVIMFLYLSEFMTQKWRTVMMEVPIWYVGCTLLAFVAMIVRDWRVVDRVGCALTVISLIVFFLLAPESLRWLEVKKKRKEFIAVSQKILSLNKKKIPPLSDWDFSEDKTEKDGSTRYNVLDLFRKGYRLNTICVMFLHFSFSMVYYAISFGAKSLYGDFYVNLFILYLIPIPFSILSMYVMTVVSRRWHTLIFLSSTILCTIISIGILLSDNQAAKDFGSTVLISLANATFDIAWVGEYARTAEMYPTVVRGIAVGIGSMSARIGGIIAPFLIPDDKSVLYIFLIVMTALTVLCCLVSVRLPETKGKTLTQTFSDDERSEDCAEVCKLAENA